jgi:hypothetical protein
MRLNNKGYVDVPVLVLGGFTLSLIGLVILFIAWSIQVSKEPVKVTQVSPQCVLIEQAGFKSVQCTSAVNVNNNVNNGD